MIGKMSDKTNSPMFKVIFALVSLSFVLGGIGTGVMRSSNAPIQVNGEDISAQAFNSAKNRQQNVLNAQLGERFWDLLDTPEYVQQFNQAILDSLIEDELLRQYAKELKLGISVQQVKSHIVNMPEFQRDGKFDNALYQQFLRSNGLNAEHYAAIVYEGMLLSQIQQGIVSSDFSVPVQQELLAKLLLQQRTVRLATYSIAKAAEDQTASNAELQQYYEANKAQFINPEQLTVEYVLITPKDIEDRIQVTADQINTYYETNKAQYVTQGEARVAHIQVADEATAQALLEQLNKGEDFAQLAKQKSADTLSAAQGGDLGWVKAGTFPADFETAMANLNPGQISQPVKVDNTFHIIKLVDRKAESVIPVEQVKEAITQTIRHELAVTEYSTLAREMANKAFENVGSLEAVAAVANLPLQKTEPFSRQYVPAVLNHEKVLKQLFNTDLRQTGQNSDALDISQGEALATLFVRVADYKAQQTQTFEQAEQAVISAVKFAKASESLQRQAEQIVADLAAGKVQQIDFNPEETLDLSQAQQRYPALAETIFAMPKPNTTSEYRVAKNAVGDVVIVALDSVEEGKSEAFQMIAPQLQQLDQMNLRNNMLSNLRERAKIEIDENFLNQINSVEQ